MAFLPMRFSASPRPTVVVVLPSPAGVGLIAVTRISLPSGRRFLRRQPVERDLALGAAVGHERVLGDGEATRDLRDRCSLVILRDLDVGLHRRLSSSGFGPASVAHSDAPFAVFGRPDTRTPENLAQERRRAAVRVLAGGRIRSHVHALAGVDAFGTSVRCTSFPRGASKP